MSKRPAKRVLSTAALPSDYVALLTDIKSRMQSPRLKAGLAVNRGLPALYWEIERLIVEARRTKGYGKQVVAQLAVDLHRAFPGVGGFSPLNVWRMRAFYAAHSESSGILSQAVTESSYELSADLRAEVPGMSGLAPQNLWYMRGRRELPPYPTV